MMESRTAEFTDNDCTCLQVSAGIHEFSDMHKLVDLNQVMLGKVRSAISCPQNLHQIQEQVDDVEVEGHGSPDVLVVRVALDDVVRVEDDVATEDDRRHGPIYHGGDLAQWEKDLDK